jgi:hypothetical protein
MKKIMKDKMFIVLLLLLALVAFSTMIGLNKYKNNQEIIKSDFMNTIANCESKNGNYSSDVEEEYCQNAVNSDFSEFKLNAYDGYGYIIEYLRKFFSEYFIIFIIIFGSSYYITKYLRNRLIINELNRKSYKSILMSLFVSAWKYAFLIPFMLIIIWFITYCYVGPYGFDLVQVAKDGAFIGDVNGYFYESNIWLYFLVILVQSILISLLYINISLIISRYENNHILSTIKSYLVVFGLDIFFELIVGIQWFNNSDIFFNILNIYNYNTNSYSHLVFLLVLDIITLILLFICYRDREKLIISSEKNDINEEV